MIYETNYIMHYNKNHDKLGRFAKGTSGKSSSTIKYVTKKVDKAISKNKLNSKKASSYLNYLDREKTNNEFARDRANKRIEKIQKKGGDASQLIENRKVFDANSKGLSDLGNYIIKNSKGSIYKEPISRIDQSVQAQNRDMLNTMLLGGIGAAVIAETGPKKKGYWYTYKNNKKGTRIKVK